MLKPQAKNAVKIGSLCSLSYMAVYIARNILSAVTPQMVSAGYSEEYIGAISSLYFVFYAVGQLINGAVGDKIHAKWMISAGLFGAGAANLVFSRVADEPAAAMAAYAVTGFCLSMIYGPMTKVVSENTEPLYATRCSLGYTFASFLGTPSAGMLAAFLAWQDTFAVSSGALFFMSAVCFLFFSHFERQGIVKYGQYRAEKKGVGNVGVLLKRGIVKFVFIAIITGVVRTSVVFWLPTYLTQRLGYTDQRAATLFSIATFVISFTAFIVIFIYERLQYNMNKTILLMFSSALCLFLLTRFVSNRVCSLICMVLAIMASNGAATMMYSRYLPSLRDTGMVSSATGFLDALSYLSAAAANLIFATAATSMGWDILILVWAGLMAGGVIVAIPYGALRKKKAQDGE